MQKSKNLTILILLFISSIASAQDTYKVTLLRAAPSTLLELIDEINTRRSEYETLGGKKPFVIRHSQGDHWDLMIYEHIGNLNSYYTAGNNLTKIFTPNYGDPLFDQISFHETIFVDGPSYSIVSNLFEEMEYFHVEMFNALPGKQLALLEQRNMENIYLKEINRNPNLIFTIIHGGNWDCFTLGGYRDIKHFAESADIPYELEEAAAIKAGFKGVNDISPYLRSLISSHFDTLGGQIRNPD